MRAGQRIFGLGRMVEAPSRPAVWIMASRTIGPEASLVLVVVTFFTGKRRIFEGRRLMTFRTRDAGVQSDQRETRQIMVKSGFLAPIVFVVTLLASWTERVLVRIIFLVTGDASCCQFFSVEIAGVAGIAFDVLVCAAERVLGFVVIETNPAPFCLVVAAIAFRTEATGMNILQPMARHAGPGEILIDLIDMTGRAIDSLVGAL